MQCNDVYICKLSHTVYATASINFVNIQFNAIGEKYILQKTHEHIIDYLIPRIFLRRCHDRGEC